MSCLPTCRAQLIEPGPAELGVDGPVLRALQERLKPSQVLFPRRDAAAEAGVRAAHHLAENDDQVVEPQHGLAGLGVDDGPLRARRPIAGRACQHDVARLGIDEHAMDALQARQDLHGLGRRLSGGQAQLHALFQSRQRDHAHRRAAADVFLAGSRLAGRAQGRQIVVGLLRRDGSKRAARIDPDAVGKRLNRAGAADGRPRRWA